MWVLTRKTGLWHYYDLEQPGVGLCGAKTPGAGQGKEQAFKPNGFDGVLCNLCWFHQELNDSLQSIENAESRGWISRLDFGALAVPDLERLSAELGEDRVLSLQVIYSLAETARLPVEKPALPLALPEPITANPVELSVIPLLIREAPKPPEPVAEESKPEEKPKEPCLRINYARPAAKSAEPSPLARLFRRA